MMFCAKIHKNVFLCSQTEVINLFWRALEIYRKFAVEDNETPQELRTNVDVYTVPI